MAARRRLSGTTCVGFGGTAGDPWLVAAELHTASDMVRRFLSFVLLAIVTGSSVARSATLTPKHALILERIAREKYAQRWEPLGTNQLGELRRKVETYEKELRRSHLVGGLVVSLRYADTNRSRVVAYSEVEDSAAWTGFYLANLAMRYVVERRTATLDGVREVLGGIERLMQSSGRPGFLPRFVGPAGDPSFQAVYAGYGGADPARPGYGRLAFPGPNGTVWLGGPSRDAYSGINLDWP